MTPDPVKDALRMVANQSWSAGFAAGLSRRGAGACLRCFIAGVVLTVLAIGVAVAQTIPPTAESHKRDLTRTSRAVFGMGAPVATLAAQIHQESGWRPDARSWAGARGLAQFMPTTAAGIGRLYPELTPVNEFDPRWALKAQSLLMRDLVRQFGPGSANACEAWCYAATAYNGGPGWTRKRISLSDTPRRCFGATSRINPGIRGAAQRENEAYPERILLLLEPAYIEAGWGLGVCGSYSKGP